MCKHDCLQVFVSTKVAATVGGLKALTSTGTSILVQGTLRRTPEGTLQVKLDFHCQQQVTQTESGLSHNI